MGREIRRVPPNWEHPKDEHGKYRAMYDSDFETAARKWLADCAAWESGSHEDLVADPTMKQRFPFFWQWNGDPPDETYYRPKFDVEPTWYQVYETVSEGTPATPPFATKRELIEYLAANGEFWDQHEGRGGWSRGAAEQFVEREWAPSLVIQNGQMYSVRDGFPS